MSQSGANFVVTVCGDAAEVARDAASRITQTTRTRDDRCGRFTLVLAGGSTPKAVYRLLADEAVGKIPWEHAHLLFGDERCVGPEHADSNYRMARETLLDCVPVPASQIHRIRGEDGPAAAASAYNRVVSEVLDASEDRVLDVVLLGVGADGHTASLFPGRDFSADAGLMAAPAIAPPASPVKDRVTLTLDCLGRAQRVMFLVTGADKREMLARVLAAAERGGDPALPASMVRCERGVEWIVDMAATDR
ncbi:MAG: 6-phosphogluconolactonase [Phycisphaerales bacterium]|nr:6-phosphogluconolactonase [Phycisphaerales bacterium]